MPCEAPVWLLLFDSWHGSDWAGVAHWNQWFMATRETRELRQETEQMGWSLVKLANELAWGEACARERLLGLANVVLPTAHAYSAWALGLARRAGLAAYLFTWLENQMMAALKAVPLGQMAGQRIVDQLRQQIPAVCDGAIERAATDPPRIHTLAPQLAILSSRHETQYSRLFRS
jgi:urease accessory protein